jgi:hypothetical protein
MKMIYRDERAGDLMLRLVGSSLMLPIPLSAMAAGDMEISVVARILLYPVVGFWFMALGYASSPMRALTATVTALVCALLAATRAVADSGDAND